MLSRISIVLAFLCNDSNTPFWTLNFFVNGEKDLHLKKYIYADCVTSLYLANIAINIPRSMTDYQLILKTTTTILTTSSLIMPSTSMPIIELCLYLTSVQIKDSCGKPTTVVSETNASREQYTIIKEKKDLHEPTNFPLRKKRTTLDDN